MTSFNRLCRYFPMRIKFGRAMRDCFCFFIKCIEIHNLFSYPPIFNTNVRRFYNPEIIRTRVHRHVKNESDVLTFWRVDRAETRVVRGVHIAYLKTRSLTSEPAGAERREKSHVFKLRENVLLVHKLRKLIRGKKFMH